MPEQLFEYRNCIQHTVGKRTPYAYDSGPRKKEPITELNSVSQTLLKLSNFAKIFGEIGLCPYCNQTLIYGKVEIPDQEWKYDEWIMGKALYGKCMNCNWWYIQEETNIANDEFDDVTFRILTYEGSISCFEIDSWVTAVANLEAELTEYRKGLKALSPSKVEKFIGQLLSQYYACDVRHIGRSHDQGIDLILVKGDNDIAVQVKHRLYTDKVEGVALVRDFVGAMVGEGYSNGIFVTTAHSFSQPAKEYVERVIRNFAPLNLITVREFRDMIRNISQNQWSTFESEWEKYLELSTK